MQSNHLINPGSRLMEMDFKQFKEVRRVTVIENGILVADYKQRGVSAHDTYNLFSSTKSITSMLIGILINLPDVELSVNDTLEDIFKNNHNYAWSRIKKEYSNNNNNNMNEYNYKKSVRLEEILTMSSGLKSMMGGYKGIINMKSVSVADAPGSDLPTSLAAPDYDPSIRGKFHYMASSNILSYIIKEKSGLSPREFADKYVFCHLGINHNLMKWDTNSDGIETSYSQLKLTTIQMCKVAQLYLQDGYYSPKCLIPLLSENWINSTQTKHIYGNAGFDHWYGYLWALYDKKYHKQHTIDDVWVAPGFNGQMIALSKETNRVVAISRLPIPMQCDDLIHYKKCVIKLLCPSRNYSQLTNGPEHVPKKFIKWKGKKMIRNPEYDRFMESKKIHSDSIGGLQQDSHHSGRRNSYTNPYI
jgi:CubicO group peptidase (beta-lactamase class C family)